MIKRILIRLATLAVLLVFLTPTTSLSAPDRRTALVIGNGAYKSSPLKNPVNDATDIANALRKFGFFVILKTNVNQRTMEDSIRDFGKKLRLGGVGLFYFAGHGLQVKGRNYLIPLGANIGSEADVKYESVVAGRVLAQMEEAENDLNIIILDACRDNPFARSFRSSGRGLAKMDAPKGSLVAYATAPGSVAADGEGRNGIYTKYLLKYISNPNLKVEEVLKQVRIGVISETDEKQIPWESSSLTGEFYFASKRGIAVAKYKSQKVKPTVFSEKPDSMELEYVETKEIRYAKSLIKRGKKSKAKAIIDDVIKNSKDETAIAEATYYQILWGLTSNEREEFEKLKAYYPNFKYLSQLEIALNNREKEREQKRLEAERKRKEEERKSFEAELEADSRIKLAIFPWKLIGSASSWNFLAVDALTETIIETNKFVPIYSYYDLGDKIKINALDKNVVINNVIDNLWIKRDNRTTDKPNHDFLFKLGRELKVDAILLGYFDITPFDPDRGHVKIILIKVRTKKIYQSEFYTDDYDNDGYYQCYNSMKKVFKSYNSDPLK